MPVPAFPGTDMGVLWAVTAGVAFGWFQALNKRANSGVDPFNATFSVFAVSASALAVVVLARGDLPEMLGMPLSVFINFAVAGLIHFFVGWTLLTLTQQRLGAARTGAIVGTTPLFGTAIAALVLHETVRPVALVGVVLMVLGVPLLLSGHGRAAGDHQSASLAGVALGLGTALCWAASPVFVRWGLQTGVSPLVGVTSGLISTSVAYGATLAVTRSFRLPAAAHRRRLAAAGIVVAVAIASLWTALATAPVAIVLALTQLATPVVVVIAPRVVGDAHEALSVRGYTGVGAIVIGSVLLVVARSG